MRRRAGDTAWSLALGLDRTLKIVAVAVRETRRMRGGGVRAYVSDLAATWPADERRWSERDATVIFADVSGFTRLSERLAALGAEGSEAVKEIINAIFEPCLEHALRAGGDVIKFAGDGFLTSFDGDDHPVRAARAAAAMQRTVRQLDTFRTPVGRIRPRLTVGAETGDVTALVLGASTQDRRDLVMTGAVVDAAFALDSDARPGQVRIGGRLAAALPQSWSRSVPRAGGRRLHVPVLPQVRGAGARRSGGDERARQFLDPDIVAVTERGRSPAEHRTITVAFVVIDGIRQLGHASGTAALADRLDDISAAVVAACRRHDVCWLESDSEHDRIRLLLTAGAPIRREHDTERLVEAVCEIAERHEVRVGVARGRAFVGDVGHDERRTYNVMGPVVNLAARLAGSAVTGSIVLTSDVSDLVRGSFETVDAPAALLKGFADPVEVAVVGGRRTVAIGRGRRSRLFGRDNEFRTIGRRIERLDNRGAAIEIVAEAGLGKSRLVEEIELTAPTPVYRADGRRDRQTTPYAAISPVVRAVLGVPLDMPPDPAGRVLLERVAESAPQLLPLAPLVAVVAQVRVPPTSAADAVSKQFRSARTREVVSELLAAVRTDPTIWIAEDVQWFDEASRQIVTGLTSVERPWLVLVTRRPDGEALDGFESLALRSLDERAIREAALDAIGDAPISRRQLADIVAASAGNPLFAGELALAAARADAGTLPDRVEAIIASRIDGLDLDSRLILRELSVAGMEADRSIVDLVLDEYGAGDEALALMRDFLTVTDLGVEFRHDLYRRAAYEALSVKRRRELHGRLASILADRPGAAGRAAMIAEHAYQARDAPATWLWARAAAADALNQGATHEAAVHLERAVAMGAALGVEPSEQARIAEMLGDALELVGRPVDAHAAYGRARRVRADDPIDQARLCRKHARVDERAGRYRASLTWSTKGLKLLDGHEHDELAAELRLVAGVVRFFQGRFGEAIELAGAAVDGAERAGATAALAQAHLQLEMAYSELGQKNERARHGDRALELLEGLDDPLGLANLHLNLGVSQYNEANWREAIEHYGRSAHYYRLVGDTIGAEAARNNQAEILTDQGRLDEAATILDNVERALRAAHYPLGVATTTSGRARIALRRGDLDVAGLLLDEARAAFVDLDARHMVIDTDVRRVEHLVWAGRADEAEWLAAQVERDLDEAGPVAVLPSTLVRLRGWAALQLGDPERAHDRFRRGLVLAEDEAFDYEVALALDGLISSGVSATTDDERARLAELVHHLHIASTPRPPWLSAPG